MTASGRDIAMGAAAGLIGGLAATWIKGRFQTAWSDLAHATAEPSQDRKQSEGQPDDSATVKAAEALSRRVLHRELEKDQKQPAGAAVDFAFGSAMGAAYGAISEAAPQARAGVGTAFGAGLWMLGDELGVPAAGLAKWPSHYPLTTHAYSLAGHLVYGFSCELLRRLFRRVLG